MSKTAKAIRGGPRPATTTGRVAAPAAARMTKRQATRAERDRRWTRLVVWGCSGALALVLAIVAFGFFYENVWRANEPIATVHGRTITVQDYAKVLGFKQVMLDAQQQQYEQYAQRPPTPGNADSAFMAQLAQQQLQQIRQQRAELEGKTVEEMMNAELMRDEAQRRGLQVTPEEINEALVDEFGVRQPTTPTTPPEPNADGTMPVATPTPPQPATVDEVKRARDLMADNLKRLKIISEPEYIKWIIEPRVLRKKLNDVMMADVPRTQPQVHARHILTDTQADAQTAIDRIKNGEDFATVAQEMSKDTGSAQQGGDLGWFPRGQMVKPFEEVAFALPPGELSRPVKSDFGYHVIEVLEKGDRELSDDQYTSLRNRAVDQWLDEQRADAPRTVSYGISSSRTMWARDYINKNLNRTVYGR